MAEKYDIVIIGAGHAGCEAGLAAARLGCKVLVLAISLDKIAHMPCNPAIGGIGKGQLVREIDALGGEMGRNIDESFVQIKVLNNSKGPAVQALRAQADKRQYSRLMKTKLIKERNIDLRQEEVVAIKRLGLYQWLVSGATGADFKAKCVVLTTGTFLKGEMIIGDIKWPGGRAGEAPSERLSGALHHLGLELDRFQSATPPRVLAGSIDGSRMAIQPGAIEALSFSFYAPRRRQRRQRDCWLTYTNRRTHDMIQKHMHLSPIRSGSVSARGPRYCPSIDRKVINFPDKDRHPVFVEPEGWRNEELYLQGLTTSMPVAVQEKIIQTVPGLENAQIIRPGYAVAYDYVKPHQLKNTLECRDLPGLFTAGQINGTSGYEEAAAQGLIAGINAALVCLGRRPLILSRAQGYIGVLIDDLVTKEIDEPYRMFTSRAEHRLVLRSDNADLRLAPIGHRIGLISDEQLAIVKKKEKEIAHCLGKLEKTLIKGKAAKDLLKRPEIRIEQLSKVVGLTKIPRAARAQAEIEIKYQGYIARALETISTQKRLEHVVLPHIDFEAVKALSMEARQKLNKIRPRDLGQASRIAGVSPADISVLMVYLEQCRGNSEKR